MTFQENHLQRLSGNNIIIKGEQSVLPYFLYRFKNKSSVFTEAFAKNSQNLTACIISFWLGVASLGYGVVARG